MSILKYCGIAFITLAVTVIISELKPKLSRLTVITAGVMLLCAALASIYPTVSQIRTMMSDSPFADYASTLLKALGVALSVEITADICRDAGEPSLASKLEMIGKAELLLLALPLISKLLGIARGLIS